jgi:hypothetical protein
MGNIAEIQSPPCWQPIPKSTNCPVTLKASWQKQALASSGYLELGMLDDAARVLEEIEPQDKTRKEVLAHKLIST